MMHESAANNNYDDGDGIALHRFRCESSPAIAI
jgi:hypothetical protein